MARIGVPTVICTLPNSRHMSFFGEGAAVGRDGVWKFISNTEDGRYTWVVVDRTDPFDTAFPNQRISLLDNYLKSEVRTIDPDDSTHTFAIIGNGLDGALWASCHDDGASFAHAKKYSFDG